MGTVAQYIRRNAASDHLALLFEDQRYSHRQVVQAAAARGALLLDERPADPFHVGVLLDNVPEAIFWLRGSRSRRRHGRRDQLDPTGRRAGPGHHPRRLRVDRDRHRRCRAARRARSRHAPLGRRDAPSTPSCWRPTPTRLSRTSRSTTTIATCSSSRRARPARRRRPCAPRDAWSASARVLSSAWASPRTTSPTTPCPGFTRTPCTSPTPRGSSAEASWPCGGVSRRRDSCPTCASSEPPTSTTWASPSNTFWPPRHPRRRRQPVALCHRQRGQRARHRGVQPALRSQDQRRLRLDRDGHIDRTHAGHADADRSAGPRTTTPS